MKSAPEPFSARLHDRQARLGTRVCLGLDPRPHAHPMTDPARLGVASAWHPSVAELVGDYFLTILEATQDLIAACKPQSAFFEALGPAGVEVLAEVISAARELGVPVILDAKRGDIGSTAEAYADAYLTGGPFAADALTVSPYLGIDTLVPFVKAAERHGTGVYVLLRTSNPGSQDLQGMELAGGGSVASRLADALAALADSSPADDSGYTAVGAVAGSPPDLAWIRERLPSSPLLVPGYGAQGATAADVAPAFDAAGHGAVVSASRSLTYGPGFAEALTMDEVASLARTAVTTMRDRLEATLELSRADV